MREDSELIARGLPLEPDRPAVEAMGRAVLGRVAAYAESAAHAPASHPAEKGPALDDLLRPPPEGPGDLDALLDVFDGAARQGVDTSSPGYLAYFPAGGLVSSALGELLAQIYNRFTGVADLAPALVAMEHGVLRWLCEEFALPPGSVGITTTGGSMATLSALVAARHDRLGDAIASGTLYATEHTHFCVERAARIAGLPDSRLRIVPTSGLRMDPSAARDMIRADRARGLRPFLLVGTAGSTSTGTIDPLPELAALARAEDLWFHVDAAYGGGFQLTRRGRARMAGIEHADSIVLDPHKSLFLQYGTGVLLVRNAGALARAHRGGGHYVQDVRAVGDLPDYGYLGAELTRDFRGLRLWLPLHLHGVAAFRAALDEKLDLARHAHADLADDPLLDVPWEPDLTVVTFRMRGGEEPTLRLLERVNATGRIFVSSTRVEDRLLLRINPTSHRTRADHLQRALALIHEQARKSVSTTLDDHR
ncbi:MULTISPECIES: pyridoxal phosphate-dependent decarboxylase family protein [Actinomadura]|uniref:Aminotransferase class V-fold PLP-dependent enzyme n=1 Tax=Actinomadura geliboluensis TaxID=882440 RepID=A0A5S4GXT6_9ACTN|nr:aminotransferase class V-fold PLP-dependent enzyme [Actinomadura geliboluensis]TMR37825.1 aminotransferase class V-fold PLP-dependent enzyme [Actinomadura geliboluensis]